MKSDKEDGLYGCWQELRVCCLLDRRHIVAGWLALTSNYTRIKTSLRFSVDKVETVKKYIATLSGEADHLLHSSSSQLPPENTNLPNNGDCNQFNFSQKHFYTTSSTRISLSQSTPSSQIAQLIKLTQQPSPNDPKTPTQRPLRPNPPPQSPSSRTTSLDRRRNIRHPRPTPTLDASNHPHPHHKLPITRTKHANSIPLSPRLGPLLHNSLHLLVQKMQG